MTISGLFLLCSSIHHFFQLLCLPLRDLFTKATGKLFVKYQPQIDDNLLITKIKYDLNQSVLKNISGYNPSKDSEKQETSHYMWNCFVLMVQFIQFILTLSIAVSSFFFFFSENE